MTAKTFGRRGLPASQAPRLQISPRLQLAPARAVSAPSSEVLGNPLQEIYNRDDAARLLAAIPFLTVGIIAVLYGIFWLQTAYAFDVDPDGDISVESLVAFGASSYDRVFGDGQWWRVLLAPLLHASTSHIAGNCVALLLVGVRLEPLIGRGWMLAIYFISALGGEVGSLIFNAPDIPGVGASGAITGIVCALYVASFHPCAHPLDRESMRWWALRLGVPALAPLAFGSSGSTDYFAHAGGAIAGGAAVWLVCGFFLRDRHQPLHSGAAMIASLFMIALSILAGAFAMRHFEAYRVEAAQFMRSADDAALSDDSASSEADDATSSQMVWRYPADPRAQVMRGFYLSENGRYAEAEPVLRRAANLASASGLRRKWGDVANAGLALVVLELGRRGEAVQLAAPLCAKGKAAIMEMFEKSKLCG